MGQLTQSQQDAIDQQQAGGAYSSRLSQASRESAINSSSPITLETPEPVVINEAGVDTDQIQSNQGDSNIPVQDDMALQGVQLTDDL